MCGIAGFCNWPGTREQQQNNLEKMKQRMLHRGPDAGGSHFTEDGQAGLGHRRLSIVDLSPTGLQPMKSHGGRYVIAYNGEIYNYKQIAGELIEEHKVDQFRAPPTRRFYWRPLKLMELKRRFQSVRKCLRLHFMILKNRC